jgi:hypothetical protein
MTACLSFESDVLPDPLQNFREVEFMLIHRALDQLAPESFDLDVETLAAQEDVGRPEGNPLIPPSTKP